MNFIINESPQKLRGGYYTPIDLARFIAKWAVEKHPTSVLEPSCGDGVFFKALASIPHESVKEVTGFELLKAEAQKARVNGAAIDIDQFNVHARDFLTWAIEAIHTSSHRFDAVVGNPPFIRYQYLEPAAQDSAEAIFKLLALPFTKHTNAWVPFVLASIALLKPGGRLAMILPSEIVHVMHAQSLRTYLGQVCSRLLIVDPEEIWFEDTLQGAVILFAEKKLTPAEHGEGLGIVKVAGRNFLRQEPSALFNKTQRINGKTVEGKWTRALLTKRELGLLDEITKRDQVHRFSDVAEVNVGIVTGANKFFLVTDDVVEKFELHEFAHPMFGRSEHCRGVIYDDQQHEANALKGNPTNFIWIPEHAFLSEAARAYIALGESENLHTRFKCRIRTPWYSVPSVHSTAIGMLKRSHDAPRLIHNTLAAYTTDTAYRITSATHAASKLVYCFLNSLTALSAELEGRHYGGGVLELVPSEIEKLLLPLPNVGKVNLRALDSLVRKENLERVLVQQDREVLSKVGLSSAEQDDLGAAWLKLKRRRQRVSQEVLT